MPDTSTGGRREGQLVQARSGTGTVHASRLIYVPARPDLGLTPWWALCSSTITRFETSEPVTCKTCWRLMRQRGVEIGDVIDA